MLTSPSKGGYNAERDVTVEEGVTVAVDQCVKEGDRIKEIKRRNSRSICANITVQQDVSGFPTTFWAGDLEPDVTLQPDGTVEPSTIAEAGTIPESDVTVEPSTIAKSGDPTINADLSDATKPCKAGIQAQEADVDAAAPADALMEVDMSRPSPMHGFGGLEGVHVIVHMISGCVIGEMQLPSSATMTSVKRAVWELWAEAPPRHAQKLLWETQVLEDSESLASFPSPLLLQLACLPLEDDVHNTLCMAAFEGRAVDVDSILRRPVSPNTRDMDGSTALMAAALKGHVEVVTLLCSAWADMTARTSKGCTALHFAIGSSSLPVVKFLVDSKAEAEGGLKQCVWLASFCETSSDDLFIFLLSKVQNFDDVYKVFGPMELNVLLMDVVASKALSLRSVKCLCEHSADPNSADPELSGHRWTALMQAVFFGRVDIVSYFCMMGTRTDQVVDIFDQKWAALDLALLSQKRNGLAIAHHLIHARAEVSNARDPQVVHHLIHPRAEVSNAPSIRDPQIAHHLIHPRAEDSNVRDSHVPSPEVSAKLLTARSADDLQCAFARVGMFAAAGKALIQASLSPFPSEANGACSAHLQ